MNVLIYESSKKKMYLLIISFFDNMPFKILHQLLKVVVFFFPFAV